MELDTALLEQLDAAVEEAHTAKNWQMISALLKVLKEQTDERTSESRPLPS